MIIDGVPDGFEVVEETTVKQNNNVSQEVPKGFEVVEEANDTETTNNGGEEKVDNKYIDGVKVLKRKKVSDFDKYADKSYSYVKDQDINTMSELLNKYKRNWIKDDGKQVIDQILQSGKTQDEIEVELSSLVSNRGWLRDNTTLRNKDIEKLNLYDNAEAALPIVKDLIFEQKVLNGDYTLDEVIEVERDETDQPYADRNVLLDKVEFKEEKTFFNKLFPGAGIHQVKVKPYKDILKGKDADDDGETFPENKNLEKRGILVEKIKDENGDDIVPDSVKDGLETGDIKLVKGKDYASRVEDIDITKEFYLIPSASQLKEDKKYINLYKDKDGNIIKGKPYLISGNNTSVSEYLDAGAIDPHGEEGVISSPNLPPANYELEQIHELEELIIDANDPRSISKIIYNQDTINSELSTISEELEAAEASGDQELIETLRKKQGKLEDDYVYSNSFYARLAVNDAIADVDLSSNVEELSEAAFDKDIITFFNRESPQNIAIELNKKLSGRGVQFTQQGDEVLAVKIDREKPEFDENGNLDLAVLMTNNNIPLDQLRKEFVENSRLYNKKDFDKYFLDDNGNLNQKGVKRFENIVVDLLEEAGVVKSFEPGQGASTLNWLRGTYSGFGEDPIKIKKELDELQDFYIENSKNNDWSESEVKTFNLAFNAESLIKHNKEIDKENDRFTKELTSNVVKTSKKITKKIQDIADERSELNERGEVLKRKALDFESNIDDFEQKVNESNEQIKNEEGLFKEKAEVVSKELDGLKDTYQELVDKAKSTGLKQFYVNEFKKEQQRVLNNFKPIEQDYNNKIKNYNDNQKLYKKEQARLNLELKKAQEEYVAYNKDTENYNVKAAEIDLLASEITSNLGDIQALSSLSLTRGAILNSRIAKFQDLKMESEGQGDWLGAIQNRFMEDLGDVFGGKIISLGSLTHTLMDLNKNVQKSFGTWSEEDQSEYDYFSGNIQSSQAEAAAFADAFGKKFSDLSVTPEYMSAFAESYFGGVMNVITTMFAAQFGSGMYAGVNPFSAGWAGASRLSAALSLGRGFYNMASTRAYNDLQDGEKTYIQEATAEYINQGLSAGEAQRRASDDWNNNVSESSKQVYITTQAAVEGALEYWGARILTGSPGVVGKISKEAMKRLVPAVVNKISKKYGGKYTVQQLTRQVINLMGRKFAGGAIGTLKGIQMGVDEMITELLQEFGQISVKEAFNSANSVNLPTPDIRSQGFQDDMKHLAAISFSSAIILGGYGAVRQGQVLVIQSDLKAAMSAEQAEREKLIAKNNIAIHTDKNLIKAQKQKLQNELDGGMLTPAEYNEQLNNLNQSIDAMSQVDVNKYNPVAATNLHAAQVEINKLEAELKAKRLQAGEVDIKKKRIEELKQLQIEISNSEESLASYDRATAYENIKTSAENLSRFTGAKVKTAKTVEEYIEQAKNLGENLQVIDENGNILEDASYTDGLFATDGKTILINENVAKNIGNISAATHEQLHKIIYNQFGLDTDAKAKLVENFKQNLTAEELGTIMARLNTNYSGENSNTEEWFNAFHDAIVDQSIEFNDSKIKKIADKVIKTFVPSMKKAGFATGRQAYNFIKDYSIQTREIAQGIREPGEYSEEILEVIKNLPKPSTGKTPGKAVKSSTIKTTLDNLVKNPDGSKKFNSKNEFQVSEEFGRMWEEISREGTEKRPNIFEGTIVEIGKKNGVPVEAMSDFVNKVKQRLQEKSMGATEKGGFDPAKNESLFGYFFGKNKSGQTIVQLATGDVANAYTRRVGKSSIDQTFDDGKTKQYEDTTVSIIENIDNKNTEAPVSKLRKQLVLADGSKISKDQIEELEAIAASVIQDPSLPPQDSPTYKKAFEKLAAKKMKPWVVKNILGGRNKNLYRQALRDNLTALFHGKNLDIQYLYQAERENTDKIFAEFVKRLTTKKEIFKYKDSGDVFVSNEDQGVRLYNRLKPKAFEVINFYLENSPQLNTNRKGILAESIGSSLIKDITPQTLYKEKIDSRKAAKINEQIQRKPTLLFSNTITLSPSQIVGQVQDKGVPVKALPGKKKNRWVMTQQERAESEQFLKDITKYFPKNFFLGIEGNANFYNSSRMLFGIPQGGKHTARIEKLLSGSKFNENAPKQPTRYTYSTKGKIFDNSIYDKINTKEFKENEKRKIPFLKYVFKTIEQDVKQNPQHAKFWEAIIRDATNSQGHFMRSMAPIKFLVKKGYKGKITEEHSLPQKLVGQFLLNAAFNGKVDEQFKFIENNYFQGALKEVDDNKLKDVKGDLTGVKYNYQQKMPDFHTFDLETWVRYINENVNKNEGGIDTNEYVLLENNKTLAENFGVELTTAQIQKLGGISRAKGVMPDIVSIQNAIIDLVLNEAISKSMATQMFEAQMNEMSTLPGAKKSNTINLKESGVLNINQEAQTNEELINKAKNIDQALRNANKLDAPTKKARVFDFDDTVARTNSKVFANRDGKRKVLTAEQFATEGEQLVSEGWEMDFSDFNRVVDGKKGPLFDLMKKMKEAAGERDMFILTARAPESAPAIKQFLDAMGIKIPLKNITGLGNSTGVAKANWIIDKAAEGYNDFYFADDAKQNVKAVRDALEVIDVKSATQQARVKFSSTLSSDFNLILEQKSGISKEKIYSKAKARVRGASKGNFKFFIPHSAEDYLGLIYATLSKGKLGEDQLAWYKKNILDPYTKAEQELSDTRLQLLTDFNALKKGLQINSSFLSKKAFDNFTNEQVARIYVWNTLGYSVPGLSNTDLNKAIDLVNNDANLLSLSEGLIKINKDGYVQPNDTWLAEGLVSDIQNGLNNLSRPKYLQQWKENIDAIYSEENLNKLEAIYGAKYREALENILKRMYKGRNRLEGGNRLSNKVLDYINGSIGTIMFFNIRSAVLQTISSINFINWDFNNPLKAGQAFANQPQFWKDFKYLFNSKYLLDRRKGQQINISESELAESAKKGPKGAIQYILSKGYLPTQIMDSFAIAFGGATFYRNRIKDLVKNQGMSEQEAREIAENEWRQKAEESQQSSNPSRISGQQASDLGRIVLAFANTPMQYARIQKRAAQDLAAGRGDAREHISKIIYYGFAQNLIFNALQNALFIIPDDDDEKEKGYYRTINGMLDSLLRGIGIGGAVVAVIKNLVVDIAQRSERTRPEYVDSINKILDFSPPISSKFKKLRQAAWYFDTKARRQEMYDKGFSLDNPAYDAIAKVISAVANIPLDRLLQKLDNVKEATSAETEWYESVAMLMGWPAWNIKKRGAKDEPKVKVKSKEALYKQAKGSTDYDLLKKLTSDQQVKMLKGLGYGNYTIKNAKTEKQKIDLIIYKNSGGKIKIDKKAEDTMKYKALTKNEQIKKLDSLGLSKSEIAKLKYEQDRVDKLLELMKN